MTLEMAVLHKEELVRAKARIVHDPRFRWYHGAYPAFDDKLESSTWSALEMVSIKRLREPDPIWKTEKLLGWLYADFSRSHGCVSSLAFARFDPKPSMEWSRDMARFMRLLFVHYGQHAVRWFVIVGSPHEGPYDRLVKLLGGTIYGRTTGGAVLADGTRHDTKLYEVLAANLNRHALDRLAGEGHGHTALGARDVRPKQRQATRGVGHDRHGSDNQAQAQQIRGANAPVDSVLMIEGMER